MIVRRNPGRKPSLPKAIVRRSRPTVGERTPRLIVRRPRGVVPPGGGHRRFRPPQFHFRRRWIVVLSLFAGVALIVGSVTWTLRSPFFKVNHLEVAGNERIGTDIIVERANLLGKSMFEADLAGAQQALYQLPLVSSVSVERKWPSTLRIVVIERQAWGSWEQENVRYTIDREGVVLGTVPPPEGSPAIRSSSAGSLRQGDRVDYQAVDAAAEIYERLPRQLGSTVTEVAYVAGKGVQVTTSSGEAALLGDSSAIAYKLAVWAAIRREAEVQGVNYTLVDLRYGNRPVVQ